MMNATKTRPMSDAALLKKLARDADCSVHELLELCTFDSVSCGICTGCHGINDSCEPDQDNGWCDECCTNTVKSALVLGGSL